MHGSDLDATISQSSMMLLKSGVQAVLGAIKRHPCRIWTLQSAFEKWRSAVIFTGLKCGVPLPSIRIALYCRRRDSDIRSL